ncbi:MAG: carboxylate--amine ligase [Candidatus Riflebacteria bacterium]|nr:carboxylate--amine ligase [Candidatus Riflebacteria bacterium]
MNVVHLSPHYPPQFGLFTKRLAEHGVKVFGISDRWDHELSPDLRQALTAHYKVDSLSNYNQVIAAVEHFMETCGHIDRVESHLESWLEIEAILRERFGIQGKQPADLDFCRRKSQMKAVYKKAMVPTARGAIVESFEQCKAFIGGVYPAFIKPDIGVGAGDTYTIHNESDLHKFFEVRSKYEYFIEEFIQGVIESFDGLTDSSGNIVFCTGHRFSDDIHNVVKKKTNLYYYSLRDLPPDLEAAGRAVVAAIDIREKFFHLEFFRLPSGDLRGLEVNLRPPGGLTTHMFNYACDVDVYDWWASIVAGEPSKRNYSRSFHCAFVSRKYDRAYTFDEDEVAARCGKRLMLRQSMPAIEWPVMGDTGFLVRSPHLHEVMEMIATIVGEV